MPRSSRSGRGSGELSQQPGREGALIEIRLLLATSRPAVEAFFTTRVRRGRMRPVITVIRDELEDLAAHAAQVAAATVAVVDVDLNPAAALEICRHLCRRRPPLPVLALVGSPYVLTPWQVEALAEIGVAGVLDLRATADEVARAVEGLARGNVVLHVQFSREHIALPADVLLRRRPVPGGPTAYPDEETEVRLLQSLTRGLSDRELGLRLHLSPHTVKHYVGRLRRRLGLHNRTELAAWAGRHGFYRPAAAPEERVDPARVTVVDQATAR